VVPDRQYFAAAFIFAITLNLIKLPLFARLKISRRPVLLGIKILANSGDAPVGRRGVGRRPPKTVDELSIASATRSLRSYVRVVIGKRAVGVRFDPNDEVPNRWKFEDDRDIGRGFRFTEFHDRV
jgi:hypothetical protein